MAALLAAALALGVISTCMTSCFYYVWQLKQTARSDGSGDGGGGQDRDSSANEHTAAQTPGVHFKIFLDDREPGRTNDASPVTDCSEGVASDPEVTDNDSKKRPKGSLLEVPRADVRVSPSVVGAGNRCTAVPDDDRASKRISWSSNMRAQLQNTTSSSAEGCNGWRRRGMATVQVYPRPPSSGSDEASNVLRVDASRNSNKSTSTRSRSPVPAKKSWLAKKLGILKKSIKRSRQSPVVHSAMLCGNRLVDASTSTQISAHQLDCNDVRKSAMAVGRPISLGGSDGERDSAEALQEVVPLVRPSAADGNSLCNMTITGLTMNRTELQKLIGAAGCRGEISVVTGEASVVSFRISAADVKSPKNATSADASTFYKNLPNFSAVTWVKRLWTTPRIVAVGSPDS